MEAKGFVLLLLCGCFLVSKSEYFNPRRHYSPLKVSDEEIAKKVNDHLEKSVEELWQKNTKADADPPSFIAKSFEEESMITGKLMYSLYGRPIYAFQGFRYGMAERFLPPKEVNKFWDGDTFNANHIGFKCPQGATAGDQPAGNEDCLFLNVYTPQHPGNITEMLPVIVFIHGGSFTSGDASYYMPTRLCEHDVILVTIHYRLGAFGFFTLDNENAPGNLALYDMVESLKWVNKHIEDFGGNRTKVTVMGESAGSVSANYMLIVEQAIGFLSGVIADSGSCFDHWGFDEDSTWASYQMARNLSCPTENDDMLLECMKNVDLQDLVRVQHTLSSEDRHNGLMGFRGSSPTLQTFTPSNNSWFELILDKRPIDFFREKKFSNVPFMTGSNKDEGTFVAEIIIDSYVRHHHLENNVTYLREQMLQDLLGAMGVTDDTHSIATSLKAIFCPDIDFGNLTAAAPCIVDISGVMFLKAGSWAVSNYHSYYSDQKTFYYSFEFESDDSLFKFTGSPFDGGVTHADDLLYLFAMPAIMIGDYLGQEETMNRMTKMWTNFAIYGDPTPDADNSYAKLGIPKWEPFMFEDHHVMVIGENLHVEREYPDRWTPMSEKVYGPRPKDEEECNYRCADYKDQKTAFMATMITFVILFVISVLVAVYFFFKARQ